jgi:diguanylate cyclase (GGDEF)-like protein
MKLSAYPSLPPCGTSICSALLMLDIDNFKQINDRFGHQLGDEVLRIVCGLVGSSIRSADLLFRVGGEEFCLVATAMDVEPAVTQAEKIRLVIESYQFPEVGRVTDQHRHRLLQGR